MCLPSAHGARARTTCTPTQVCMACKTAHTLSCVCTPACTRVHACMPRPACICEHSQHCLTTHSTLTYGWRRIGRSGLPRVSEWGWYVSSESTLYHSHTPPVHLSYLRRFKLLTHWFSNRCVTSLHPTKYLLYHLLVTLFTQLHIDIDRCVVWIFALTAKATTAMLAALPMCLLAR